jgi:hypothetical protein
MKHIKSICFSLLCNLQTDWRITQPSIQQVLAKFDFGVSSQSMKLTNSVPSAQLRNEWYYTTTTLISLHGVNRGQILHFYFSSIDMISQHVVFTAAIRNTALWMTVPLSYQFCTFVKLVLYQRIKIYKH